MEWFFAICRPMATEWEPNTPGTVSYTHLMDLTPYGRYGEPSELCGAVIYLLSESASFTSGADIVIDGCYTCV